MEFADSNALPLEVAATNDVALDIRELVLRAPGGEALPRFEPGAHIQLRVETAPGVRAWRAYSLVGDPEARTEYRIAVLYERDGRGGSRFVHEQLGVGTSVHVLPPANEFQLTPGAGHTVLIAGGIGVTPILSMTRELARRGASFEVHYVARVPQRMAFRGELESLAPGRVTVYFDQVPEPRPLVLGDVLANAASGKHMYVCGPPGMIRAAFATARELGWADHQLHAESFGAKKKAGDRPIDVELARSGFSVHVNEDQTVLEALLEAGVWAPHDCLRGECASCTTRVLEGEPDHRDICLTDELRRDHMTTCVSRVHGDHLVLDL